MVGGGYLRNIRSPYSRARSAPAPSDVAEGSSRRGRGSSQGPSQDDTEVEAQLPTQDEEVQERDEESPEEDEEAQHTASGSAGSSSAASGASRVYLRGPSSLPHRPIPRDRRPLITPDKNR
ncbi:hypothetical protein GQ55_7G122600 [Panicum hallii var. hallii]|uniref:Uncharacterized protein n=1 Tax=Panicum hallii var. hallii TaxID=1504633 RepID=A0A2T7CUJ6_9POAL|nr:hypothetical protein GQ55_7G122600 [Panicum hallii var. hallii]